MTAGAGAALASVGLPATASANFVTPQCGNTSGLNNPAAGEGASLQRVSQNGTDFNADSTGWAFTFAHDSNSVCPTGGNFDIQNALYQATGSGAGQNAVCVNGTSFATNPNTGRPFDFAAADDPPTSTQISNANNCSAAASPPLALHTIPVAQAAIAMIVHLPTGCTINSADNASTGDRFDMLNSNLEGAFFNGGSAPTWATLLPHSGSCSGAITRAVRYDKSGTTFQTMNYLAQLNSSDQSTWQLDSASGDTQDHWPNNGSHIVYGGTTAGNPNQGVCTAGLSGSPAVPPTSAAETATQNADCNGAGMLAQAVLDTPGSVGYVDMSTAISKGFAYPTSGTSWTFWVPVQNNGTGTKGATFAGPNVNANGYKQGQATGGANCASSSYTPPSGSNPTLSAWDGVFGSNPNQADYPACTLTYELLFNDNSKAFGDTTAEDQRSRSVKDYIEYILSNSNGNDGQSILRSLNYDTLPSSILSVARTGANAITWGGVN
jgi:ABC-type phosphate transport system substrate-binding protein